METWKCIPGWEGWYEVSDKGRVRSLPRWSIANGAKARYAGRVLTLSKPKNGYLQVVLSRPGERCYAYVHRLVLLAFKGLPPENTEVCHADGSRDNNKLRNLRYGSRKENAEDRIAHGRGPTGEKTRGADNGNAKLTESDVVAIRAMPGALKYIADVYGVSIPTIHYIKTRKTWKHLA